MGHKIWANSGDSHFLERDDLYASILPPELAERMPRAVKDPDGDWETVYLDGESFRRRMPRPEQLDFYEASVRAPGAGDVALRLQDLDHEGIWGELVFPSLGMWNASIKDPVLLREGVKASNDWALAEIQHASPRFVVAAQLPMRLVDDAVDELQRLVRAGGKAVFLPTSPPTEDDYNRDSWEPLWEAAEAAGMVIAFHIGTDPVDLLSGQLVGVTYRGPGGAVLNHTETTFSGQRAVMKMVASGALDRHPRLRVLVSEGGASWVPFLGDRMDEAYRQHGSMVRPKLSRSPKEILYDQVYASFQHDASAASALTANGYRNVMWGSDYPHLEGTYGHTQETLHTLFDDLDEADRHRITVGSFLDLFPDVGEPPALVPT
ncbi:MAG: amidohydrolase family protein [Ilumatobacteraceae bacterium]